MKLSTEKDMLKGVTRFTLSWEWSELEIVERAQDLKVLRDEKVPLAEKLAVLVEAMKR